MPTFSSTQVHITPQTLSTSLTLNEMHALLVARAPQGSTHSHGWRAITDDLDKPVISDNPGVKPPAILPPDPAYLVPERLAARLITWEKRPVEGLLSGATEAWFMDGVDVLISKQTAGFMLVWSTNEPRLLNDTSRPTIGSAVAALLSALRAQDPSADITSSSELKFDRQAYLWLTAAVSTKKDIGHGVTVSRVAGMGTDELSGRQRFTNKLDGEVGLGRTSFLSAIGSDALLGPAEVKFRDKGPTGRREHTAARIHTHGGAKLLASESVYEASLLGVFKRLRMTERLVYRYLPRVRDGFADDKSWGTKERDQLILEKQVLLIRDFRRRAKKNPQYAAWVAAGGDINAD